MTNPANLTFLRRAVDQDGVEAQRHILQLWMLLQPESGEANQALLFGLSDRGRGPAKLIAAPLPDFGDGNTAVFSQNQVDLTEARAIILRHDLHALLL